MDFYCATEFRAEETHGFVGLANFSVLKTSAGLGWSSVFLSTQAELPYTRGFDARPDILVGVLNAGSLSGRLTIRNSSNEVRALPGAVCIVPNGASCHVDLKAPIRTTHLYIRRAVFDEVAESICQELPETIQILPRAGTFDPFVEQLCHEAREALDGDPRSSGLYIDHIVRALAAHLLRKHSSLGPQAVQAPDGKLSARNLTRIRETVESRLSDQLSISDIAAGTGMGPDHLGRLFKQTTGMTLYQFVIRCRIDRARRLLSETKTPTATIALECGFSDQVSLTRTFRRVVGTTPAAFRHQAQK
ncbi:MAG: helix-turn-helix transcriptional regulator [Xanthobacteraceae bacterium]|jgi:AraC family transcriptional regulator|nr:helix-turn-helix transcriptional regulator [Xanthobacteraceae bacterium]